MSKTCIKFTLSALLVALTAGLTYLAKGYTAAFFAVYPPVSKALVSFLAEVTSFCPFDVWEIIALLLAVWCIINLKNHIKDKNLLAWLADTLLAGCAIVFLFVGLWGLNYYAPPMAGRIGLEDVRYTPAQLAQATQYYCDKASYYADLVDRGADGQIITDFTAMAHRAGDGYKKLAEDMPVFSGSAAPVKKLLTGRLFTMRGTTGIFICLTGESNVSAYVYSREMPFTMCHEIGHRMAFARENEANFAGFLACVENEDIAFKYSGYYLAYIYCFNALYRVSPDTAVQIRDTASPALRADLQMQHEHYKAIEIQKAVEISDQIYNQYLNSFDVPEGVQSYGMVVDLLTMWYYQRVNI